jgi:hypothetical protein
MMTLGSLFSARNSISLVNNAAARSTRSAMPSTARTVSIAVPERILVRVGSVEKSEQNELVDVTGGNAGKRFGFLVSFCPIS